MSFSSDLIELVGQKHTCKQAGNLRLASEGCGLTHLRPEGDFTDIDPRPIYLRTDIDLQAHIFENTAT